MNQPTYTLSWSVLATLAFVVLVLVTSPGVATAQTIDAGRGPLPVTVPSSYSDDTAAPLIILLHTYGRTGVVQDEYMGLSGLADAYGFISVAPDGTPSEAENNPRFWNASKACCNSCMNCKKCWQRFPDYPVSLCSLPPARTVN